ncbi:MAG: carboxypeptidase-like regulatory domain-containing protein [Pyrinomonadaceae bacterium]
MKHVRICPRARQTLLALATVVCLICTALPVVSQDTVTGAFEGTVTNSDTGDAIASATALIINQQTGQTFPKIADSRGRFYQGLLAPGVYTIRVSAPGYVTKEVQQRLFITRTGEVVPVPVALDPAPAATPTPVNPPSGGTATATPTPATAPALTAEDTDIRGRINASDARQGGAFIEEELSTLPLGGRTVVRSFDELTLLLPGVAPPPQTLGTVAGPGVGAGVGSAGQFSVNGLRSRANNFTVDGSDNNDEDIGVRRQGFVALNSQPLESVKEYQAITLLAPAQFGRNIGAQVNAVSKSGGSGLHGAVYGFFNASQLNARNPFDTNFGNGVMALTAGNNQPVLVGDQQNSSQQVTNLRPLTVRNQSGGEDSFTFGQFGFVLGGPLERRRGPDKPPRMFYFVSAEGYTNNATKEESFAVPTVDQRGAFGSGATGIFVNPLEVDPNGNFQPFFALPTTPGGDAIFSLFPFPNNPQGVYGRNTFTQVLPASARGEVVSGKFDGSFRLWGRQHSLTNRYNLTDDHRFIPSTGGAIFSGLEPRVRTQNNSFFLNSELSGANSTRPVFNQLRLSYGRTRLNFLEVRDRNFQLNSTLAGGAPFLLNAPLLENFTLPDSSGQTPGPNTGPVIYLATPGVTVQNALGLGPVGLATRLGAVGQVNIAGFSPVGTDVFNFPQRRVNNTYQVADELTMRTGRHTFVFGADTRRSELNSELPRIARPLVTFSGAPELDIPADPNAPLRFTGRFFRPETFAAASAASGFFQTLALRGEQNINLRFYQLDFYAQDTFRVRPTVALSLGLRYEYNTPVREVNRKIENTFNDPLLSFVPGLRNFIGNRSRIFEPDRNNFAPRVSIAWSPNLFGRERGASVLRAGYGLFYDQILGAVVSQSRNVYPTYLTVNTAGGFNNLVGSECPAQFFTGCALQFFNPSNPIPVINGQGRSTINLVQPGTLNTVNPALSFAQVVNLINSFVRNSGIIPPISGFGATLPAQRLDMPMAHQFSFSFDQQLGRNIALTATYAGTRARNLLRFTTPNLGPNAYQVLLRLPPPVGIGSSNLPPTPQFLGITLPPGSRIPTTGDNLVGGRPNPNVGTIYRFETSANSNYDSLQLQLRSRLARRLQLQAAYTFAHANDDVSDVFDLAGASSLPQDSLNLAAERGPANFDVRQRFAYNFIYDLPGLKQSSALVKALLGGWQLASLGSFQTGQPFTVNSIFDVNLDGNLTDRLNTTSGIVLTGNRSQPLRLTGDPLTLLAPIGQNGRGRRNSFRAGNVLDLNAALSKRVPWGEQRAFSFRLDVFNFINRANYGIPVRYLEAPGFGQATNTVTSARRIQFSLKFAF